jgi:hypothetical protein
MDDFTLDVVQKKRIAQGARYRKRGSKSRKCSLSTDYMTAGQWKKRNGEVMSYQLNKPMQWTEFKATPVHIQKEYTQNLIERFCVNATKLSDMFGVSTPTIRKHFEANDFGITFRVGNSMKASEREAWEEFLTSGNEPVVFARTPKLEESADVSRPPIPAISLNEFSISFSGEIDAATIANSIMRIAGTGATGHIEIKCFLS